MVAEAFRLLIRQSRAPADFHARVRARVAQEQAHQAAGAWTRRRGWLKRLWEQPTIMMPALTSAIVIILMLQAWDLYRSFSEPRLEAPRRTKGLSKEPTQAQGPPSMAALIREGDQYVRAGDTARAIATYQEAIDQVAHPLNQLAWLLHEQGRLPEGLPLVRLAVQLRPDNAAYLDTLAVLLCKEGQSTEAVQWMERAAERAPRQFRPKLERFQRGSCQ